MRNLKKILLFSFLILFSIAAHAQVYDTVEGKKYFDKAQKLSGSYSKQAKLYSKASDLGYVAANAPLDNIYQWGYGVDRDFSKRILYMKRSAEAGDTKAMLTVAGIYLGDEIYSYPLKNTDSAIHWYEKAAKNGNIDAMKKLSFIYSNWDEAFRNPLRAKLWEAEAADAGDPAAIVKRALATKSPADLYEAGMKLRQRDDVHMQYAGEELLEESGKRGYGKSFYELAQMNRFISGKEDLVLIYYRLAAEQGYAVPPLDLAHAEASATAHFENGKRTSPGLPQAPVKTILSNSNGTVGQNNSSNIPVKQPAPDPYESLHQSQQKAENAVDKKYNNYKP